MGCLCLRARHLSRIFKAVLQSDTPSSGIFFDRNAIIYNTLDNPDERIHIHYAPKHLFNAQMPV